MSVTRPRRFRLLRAYWVTLRVLASYAWATGLSRLRGQRWLDERLPILHRRNARRVRDAILELKGLFVKVGQLISIMSNFLPEGFRAELEGLQDQIPPRPLAEIEARIRLEFGGRGPDELFAHFEREPIASASLAQVHAATLADGRKVAVKVQHIDIEATARLDLNAIRRILGIVGRVARIRGLGNYHADISQMIHEELDFAQEARNIEAIAANFEGDPGVSVPRVIEDLSGGHVLTTLYVKGVKVTDLAALDARGIDRKLLAERILAAYCQMIFSDGIYHADPHPGNILVRDGGEIVFVDFGAVARLSPDMKQGIPRLLEGILSRDARQVLDALRQMGFVARETEGDVAERLIDYFQRRLLEDTRFDSWRLDEIRVDPQTKLEALADLRQLDLSLRELTATFQVPRDWILLERTILLLMGVCTELDPGMSPMGTIVPYLQEFVLGNERDWPALIAKSLREVGISILGLPGELRATLERANRGELTFRVAGQQEHSMLVNALGHQVVYAVLGAASAVVAYFAHARDDEAISTVALAAGGIALLCLAVSFLRARRYTRVRPAKRRQR